MAENFSGVICSVCIAEVKFTALPPENKLHEQRLEQMQRDIGASRIRQGSSAHARLIEIEAAAPGTARAEERRQVSASAAVNRNFTAAVQPLIWGTRLAADSLQSLKGFERCTQSANGSPAPRRKRNGIDRDNCLFARSLQLRWPPCP